MFGIAGDEIMYHILVYFAIVTVIIKITNINSLEISAPYMPWSVGYLRLW